MKVNLSWLNDYVDLQVDQAELLHRINTQLGEIEATHQFKTDTVIEIENKMFTHRPDCFGLIGVAREIATITNSTFKRPTWYYQTDALATSDQQLQLDIRCPELVPRFAACLLHDCQIGVAEEEIRWRLASIEYESVNNVVDMTNYLMYLTAQPSHAFDYDKLLQCSSNPQAPCRLIVRLSEKGERLRLISGKEIAFESGAIVIATDKQIVALAGIMGGEATKVDESTRRVLVECANFDMYSVRRSTMHYGVFSEAATRFTKGQSPAQITPVLQEIARRLGAQAPTFYTFETTSASPAAQLTVDADFISQRLGAPVTTDRIVALLQQVEFGVVQTGDTLTITPPFWRTDIEIAEDIVEEIGRLNGGYQTLQPVLPQRSTHSTPLDKRFILQNKVRRCLATKGANEVLGYSFVAQRQLTKYWQNPQLAFHLVNPLNPQLEVYRQSLTPSLLNFVDSNRRAGKSQFALFEVGCVHLNQPELVDEEGLPLDLPRVSLVSYLPQQSPGEAFYMTKVYLELLAQSLNLKLTYEYFAEDTPPSEMYKPYCHRNRALVKINQDELGIIGLLDQKGFTAGFEIKMDVLQTHWEATRAGKANIRVPAKYPVSLQSVTLQVPLETAYSDLLQALTASLQAEQSNGWQTAELTLLSIFQPADQKDVKHVCFQLTAGRADCTVTSAEVSELVQILVKTAQANFNAQQVL